MIRHAKLSDLHQVRYLAQTSFAPYAVGMGQQAAPMSADFRDLAEEGRLYVYMVENAVRGFITFHIDGPDVHVEAMAVSAKFRRQGIGRSMLDYADKEGLKAGCRRVILYTNVLMFENIAYYLGKGFQETDRREEEGFDRVYFERYLR